ncbi:MAG: hypothetical protein WAQ27_05605 [Candidatus Microsaccharimonas sp.]
MTLLSYLQLQPVDPQDDGTVSDLDDYNQDEIIDLSGDTDGEQLEQAWEKITQDLHENTNDSSR